MGAILFTHHEIGISPRYQRYLTTLPWLGTLGPIRWLFIHVGGPCNVYEDNVRLPVGFGHFWPGRFYRL